MACIFTLNYIDLLILGGIAGFTIFLGLPLAVLNISGKRKGFLNAIAIGILVFLVVDVFSHAWDTTGAAASDAFAGSVPVISALTDLVALFGGIAIGLLGLVLYEASYMKQTATENLSLQPEGRSSVQSSGPVLGASARLVPQILQVDPYKLSMMIAIGIGAHNFSEGLAIGQSFASGAIGFALILIVGFGAHNATEGFGIAGPLTGLVEKPTARFLATAGLVGGGPTFLGTLAGSLIGVSDFTYIFFLSIAGGALVYVSMLMYGTARRQTSNRIVMTGIFVGLCAGFITDLIVTLGGA
ncbi:MAG: hypothetical protein JRN20_06640 [Nitrososphaerota archaeon]|nr:hypothetical protein [Nitrososphaerota archaeon]MDG6921942.1 hypothetical protein [Nitrososphaerota archaeon]